MYMLLGMCLLCFVCKFVCNFVYVVLWARGLCWGLPFSSLFQFATSSDDMPVQNNHPTCKKRNPLQKKLTANAPENRPFAPKGN